MKGAYLILLALLVAAAAKAQDVITLTNGTQVQARVLEINPGDIKYKDYNNPGGPVITVLRSNVSTIKYANGSVTVISEMGAAAKPAPAGGNKATAYHRSKHTELMRGWYFGGELELGTYNVGNSDPDYSTSAGSLFALNFEATYMFNRHVGVQFGLGREGADYYVTYGNAQQDPFEQGYWSLPARVVYFSNSKKKAGLYVIGGLSLSLLTSAVDEEGDNLSGYYSSPLLNAYLSSGVEFHFRNARSCWLFGPYCRRSLGPLYSGSAFSGYIYGGLDSGNTGHATSIGLSITYMTRFGRI